MVKENKCLDNACEISAVIKQAEDESDLKFKTLFNKTQQEEIIKLMENINKKLDGEK